MKAKTKLNSPAAIADFVMRDAGDIIVFVGPTLDYVDASGPGFVVATADKDMQLRVDLITDPGGMREAVALALSARRPLVLNLVEDSEYQLARLVASCWPGPMRRRSGATSKVSPTRPRASAAMPQRPQIADGGRHDPIPGDRRGGPLPQVARPRPERGLLLLHQGQFQDAKRQATDPADPDDTPSVSPSTSSSGSINAAPVSSSHRTGSGLERPVARWTTSSGFARSGPTSTGPTSTEAELHLPPDLSPTLVVQSSPGHFHLYWLVEDFPLAAFKAAQLKLAELTGGDMGVAKNAAQGVLRLPGYFHQKGEPFRTFVDQIPPRHWRRYPAGSSWSASVYR